MAEFTRCHKTASDFSDLSVQFIHHSGYFLFQFIKKLGTVLLPVSDFKEYPVEITYFDIEQGFAAECYIFQTGGAVIKTFAGIEGIDELYQGYFTVRPLQQVAFDD